MDLSWMAWQVYEPKNSLSKFADLSDTTLQVDGRLEHFTLKIISQNQQRI